MTPGLNVGKEELLVCLLSLCFPEMVVIFKVPEINFLSFFSVKPRKGDALLFFSLKPDASPDEFSLHAGCPVLKGTKWSATKWIHVKAFDPPTRDPNKCENDNPHCEEWAAAGECEKNKPYMIGEGSYIGTCRRACKACNSHLVGKV